MATREEKIEEFHKHLKYREHILEFAGPKMDVTEEAAAEEPPNYSKVFDLEKRNQHVTSNAKFEQLGVWPLFSAHADGERTEPALPPL